MVLQSGDVIERPGPWPTQHRGIVAGRDVFGRIWVIHNEKGSFVKYDLLQAFAGGHKVVVVPSPALASSERLAVVRRAQSLLGRQYHLLNFNCEHLVTYALAGAASSPQLQACAALTTLVALLFFV
jgi:lecithin:retinol acyltransferase